jgi:hypothetical protein
MRSNEHVQREQQNREPDVDFLRSIVAAPDANACSYMLGNARLTTAMNIIEL